MARPILAIFGQPGSGKSTLFKRVYALIYGGQRAVVAVSTVQNFEQAMASDPLVVLDNVDTFERWLPDAIARAAGVSEISKRKLYTDTDTITMRLQAFLGITAHNPKFGREDVLDRFILLMLERIQSDRLDETSMITRVLDARNKYWGQIAQDCQKVLAEPPATNVAQYRIQDYSTFGQRIANALGYGDTFRDAIRTMVDQQKGFVLDEDSVLVNIIDQYIKSPRYKNDEWQTPAKLWGLFDLIGGIDKTFSKQYNNSVKLGRKLWAMQDALKQRFRVEWRFDPTQRTKVWRFLELIDDET
jgi:ABC-type dipeptide/oligopeptide/nickel transport system ATPase component